jgi:hypothetical protein
MQPGNMQYSYVVVRNVVKDNRRTSRKQDGWKWNPYDTSKVHHKPRHIHIQVTGERRSGNMYGNETWKVSFTWRLCCVLFSCTWRVRTYLMHMATQCLHLKLAEMHHRVQCSVGNIAQGQMPNYHSAKHLPTPNISQRPDITQRKLFIICSIHGTSESRAPASLCEALCMHLHEEQTHEQGYAGLE